MGVMDIETKVAELAIWGKNNTQRIEKLEEVTQAIYEQNSSIKVLIKEMAHTNESIQKLDMRIASLEKKPTETLNKIVTAIISALAGGLISIAIAAIFTQK